MATTGRIEDLWGYTISSIMRGIPGNSVYIIGRKEWRRNRGFILGFAATCCMGGGISSGP